MVLGDLFLSLPERLRRELISEFEELIGNFSQGRWRASGLNGGRFSEVVYCVIEGASHGEYPEKAAKPSDFAGSCRQLESKSDLPRSFRFVIPRILAALYEMRNQRNIGHIGGDIDPNFMDASFAVASAKWIMAELIRYFHSASEHIARDTVNVLSQYASPLVWSDSEIRRVLDTKLSLDNKILVLLCSAGGRVSRDDLFRWCDHKAKSTFNRRLAHLHNNKLIESKAYGRDVQILPPGARIAAHIGSPNSDQAG